MKKGIDVSHYQLNIDWARAKNKIDYAIVKIGEGMYLNQKDSKFERNYSECKRLQIPIGVYHYCYAKNVTEAKKEARCVIEWLNGRDLDLPVYLDIEAKSIEFLGKNVLTEIVIAFCSEIEKAGYWAGVYANLYWFNHNLKLEQLRKMYTLWIAHVDNTHNQTLYDGQFDMFQYSWTGKVDGILDNVDMDVMYRDLITEIKNSKNKVNRKSEDEIVQEVMKGLWGNGEERKQKLQNAGYEYNSIQSKINSLYGQNIINNTNRKNNEEIAKEVIRGLWGNGEERKQKLENAGYNYQEIQNIVNLMMR